MPAVIGELRGLAACYVHPLGRRVLIRPTETPDEVGSGATKLILPQVVKEIYPTEGEVIDVGPEVDMVPVIGKDGAPEMDEHGQPRMRTIVQPGDRVVYSRYTGFELRFGDGVRFLLVPAEDIAGILDPECPVLQKEKPAEFVPR